MISDELMNYILELKENTGMTHKQYVNLLDIVKGANLEGFNGNLYKDM